MENAGPFAPAINYSFFQNPWSIFVKFQVWSSVPNTLSTSNSVYLEKYSDVIWGTFTLSLLSFSRDTGTYFRVGDLLKMGRGYIWAWSFKLMLVLPRILWKGQDMSKLYDGDNGQ